jgi:plastocyanin
MTEDRMISKRLMAALVALSAIVVFGAAACSSAGKSADPTPVQTFKITPSSGGAATKPPGAPTAAATSTAPATAAATSAASPAATSEATPAATSGGGGTKLVLIAINLQWDKTELSAPAGPITFEIDNQDPGQPHNIHIYKGTDVTGEDMGMTQLNIGPTKDTLDVTLEKGQYFYQCDVHPTTMFGTLTVN